MEIGSEMSEAVNVIPRIRRRIVAIQRTYRQGSVGVREVNAIDSIVANLRRLESFVNPEQFAGLVRSLEALRSAISSSVPPAAASFAAERIRPGSRGRPTILITRDQVQLLKRQGFTGKAMARILGCSASYMYKKLRSMGISLRDRFTHLDDRTLDQHVRRLNQQFPRSGSQMMQGYLHSEGIIVQRRRVREALQRIDPAGAALRWSNTVARRAYHVPFPNSLWHIDAHMRLVRWGIVTHAAIDGNSRVITFLQCSANNTALTVLSYFLRATCQYGLPSRVRSDHGGENTLVALTMNIFNGQGRGSHICGRSVHNQRIERLWRDVFTQVVHYFYNLFHSFEDEGILNPDDDIHKSALHLVYMPELQQRLNTFRSAWNNHRLRTENNRSPNQIWMEGMLANQLHNTTAMNNIFGDDPFSDANLDDLLSYHGIHLDQLQVNPEELERAVVVQQPQLPITPEQEVALQDAIAEFTDLKLKYQACCSELANLLSQL